MNDLLRLHGRLESRHYPSDRRLSIGFPKTEQLRATHLERLAIELEAIKLSSDDNSWFMGVIVDTHYRKVVAKSNRIVRLLKPPSQSAYWGIVGARFEPAPVDSLRHVITHYVPVLALDKAIHDLSVSARFVNDKLDAVVDYAKFESINHDEIVPPAELHKTPLLQIFHDAVQVAHFATPRTIEGITETSFVHLYPTELSARELLEKLGLPFDFTTVIDDSTLLLTPEQYSELLSQAPQIVAMTCPNDFDVEPDDAEENLWEPEPFELPSPGSEPIVGVIDTLFDETSPFADWVDYRRIVDPEIRTRPKDYEHGTQVTSLIVAGHRLNPQLDDGCGYFRVRHFGVALEFSNTLTGLIRDIRRIVTENLDIKIWNLSLGTDIPVSPNYISPLAACLDELQYTYDVLFVVAGTNDNTYSRELIVGSPADSVNSLVVNSVRLDGSAASYSRHGPILSFFTKPDVSAPGGDAGQLLKTYGLGGVFSDWGTSLAAPWITRKMAYLVYVMDIPCTVAKALIIDSTLSWNAKALADGPDDEVGYGVVPTRIEDVLSVEEDEIRFYIDGKANLYETYTLGIPVPLAENAFPYLARAVLNYIPKCTKVQGVDYTDTELALCFGRFEERIKKDGSPYIAIKPITNKYNDLPRRFVPTEQNTRVFARKWDNVKIVAEGGMRSHPRKVLSGQRMWGITLTKTERSGSLSSSAVAFGLVISLKALDGKNRIDDFIQQCMRNSWIVQRKDFEAMLKVRNEGDADIKFEG